LPICVTKSRIGVTHEGTAEGKWEKIGGVDSYIATPTVDYPKDKIILFVTDVFGVQLINAQVRRLMNINRAFNDNLFSTCVLAAGG